MRYRDLGTGNISNISLKRFKDVIIVIGVVDGADAEVDGQWQTEGSS
jgi:hypothetical protein